MSSARTPATARIRGLMARYASESALKSAARAVRAAGYTRFDAHTPYPIHGMDRAMGQPPSRLGWLVAAGGVAGVGAAMGLQWFANAYDYPLITGGKPYFSWQAFVPVTFELMVLGASLAAVGGMFLLNRLPEWYHPAFKSDAFLAASDDALFLIIDADDPQFDEQRTRALLEKTGGREIVTLDD